MSMIRSGLRAAGLVPFFVLSTAAIAQPSQRGYVQLGVLRCDVSGGIGQIIGSARELRCVYERARGRPERYLGVVQHAGLDIGFTARGVMAWGVLAPSRIKRGALTGRYVGASAEATAGLGVGANVLVGGSQDSIALQPLSVQAQAGLNIAVGVAELTLKRLRRHAPLPPQR